MSVKRLLSYWKDNPLNEGCFSVWQTQPARPADLHPLPPALPPALRDALQRAGIHSLYGHQAQAWEAAQRGENVVLATGTASGKTLAYHLPILARLQEDAETRALYLFPTKALAQDQLSGLRSWFEQAKCAIYDGDTPQGQRAQIRKEAQLVFSNPDMLHTGILPHHAGWAAFFARLRFVVLDEMHTYRGVFGSHVANVVRRLKRVAAFYGANPQFLLTSATIGNPAELAQALIHSPCTLVEEDGAARGERVFALYNPPVINEALGLRKGAASEAARLAKDALDAGAQTVVFARSRRGVEMLLTQLGTGGGAVRGYRSGYLPSQRREIEQGLRSGAVRLVVATNALELGIDIGGLSAAILVGYPGSVASLRQQAGRAGRGSLPSAALLVASANPLDQFLAHHPEYILGRSPEQALINPNHLLILLNHLRCAAFELPFAKGEYFGGENVDEFLDFLTQNGEAHFSQDRYFWMSDSYPAAGVSLRSASPETVVLQAEEGGSAPRIIGEIDLESAHWMVHPQAVYLHEAQQYYVQSLNLEAKRASLIPVGLDYYTEAIKEMEVQILSVQEQTPLNGAQKGYGEMEVSAQVVGYKKLRWFSRENLGQEPLTMPPVRLQTTGYWLTIQEQTIATLSAEGLWSNSPNDYGADWQNIRAQVRARDAYRCQVCGMAESSSRQHHVHHKTPFRAFRLPTGEVDRQRANAPANLVTLCPACHRAAEQNVRIRSGLAGLAYLLGQIAPLFLMCDPEDLGTHLQPEASASFPQPGIALYDLVPAGIGFSQKLYEMHPTLLQRAEEVIRLCPCLSGCPSCVGPGGENGSGAKAETLALLRLLNHAPNDASNCHAPSTKQENN